MSRTTRRAVGRMTSGTAPHFCPHVLNKRFKHPINSGMPNDCLGQLGADRLSDLFGDQRRVTRRSADPLPKCLVLLLPHILAAAGF